MTPPAAEGWAAREARLCEPPMAPSNHSTIALAQEWMAEMDLAIDTQGLRGYDPFDIKQHPWMRAAQPRPLLRKGTSVLGDLAPRLMRRALRVAPSENPKAYALAALAKMRLFQLTREQERLRQAEGMLERLVELRAAQYPELCWGYPFSIKAQGLDTPAGTPIAVLSGIAGQAFSLAYLLTRESHYLNAARSIAGGMLELFPQMAAGDGTHCFAYAPTDKRRVHNANLLVAEHLLRAAALTGEQAFAEAAMPALRYTLQRQRADGAWPYGEAEEGSGYERSLLGIVDHHHSGFVLRSLHAIRGITGDAELDAPLRSGFGFYKKKLLSPNGMPRNAHGVYPVDIHACAEAVLCPSVLARDVLAARGTGDAPLRWTYANLRDPLTGLPWYRKYPFFTSRIHLPRWGTAWMYYALSEYLMAHCAKG